jgi:hypothetical protein
VRIFFSGTRARASPGANYHFAADLIVERFALDLVPRIVFERWFFDHGNLSPFTQLRKGVIRDDWQNVNVAKYQAAYLPPSNAPAK